MIHTSCMFHQLDQHRRRAPDTPLHTSAHVDARKCRRRKLLLAMEDRGQQAVKKKSMPKCDGRKNSKQRSQSKQKSKSKQQLCRPRPPELRPPLPRRPTWLARGNVRFTKFALFLIKVHTVHCRTDKVLKCITTISCVIT